MRILKTRSLRVVLLMLALFALVLAGCVQKDVKVNEVPAEKEYTYVNPDKTKAETDAGIKIDGILDEEAYKNNNWLYLHNEDGGNKVDIAMTSYFGEKGMYFVYDVTESVPIYVNLDRASYMNSCIEMYLAHPRMPSAQDNGFFEIDLLPTGDMIFKKANGKYGYENVATTDDIMAVLGATTKGGEVNTEDCYGYCMELFIPWDYLQWLKMDVEAIRNGYVYVTLWLNSTTKCFKTSRLVAKAFIPNPNNLPEVDHLNADKQNNTVSNLEWVTGEENRRREDAMNLRNPHRWTDEEKQMLRDKSKAYHERKIQGSE